MDNKENIVKKIFPSRFLILIHCNHPLTRTTVNHNFTTIDTCYFSKIVTCFNTLRVINDFSNHIILLKVVFIDQNWLLNPSSLIEFTKWSYAFAMKRKLFLKHDLVLRIISILNSLFLKPNHFRSILLPTCHVNHQESRINLMCEGYF